MNLIILIFAILNGAFASTNGLSAFRHQDETYENAKARAGLELSLFLPSAKQYQPFYNGNLSAERQKKQFKDLSFAEVPEINEAELNNLFTYLRDTPFMQSDVFPRRATWLYPDDGCYARAALMGLHYSDQISVEPKKIFAFGDLKVDTKNSPQGYVTWWYHVAIAYRVQDRVYVLDPAVEASRPITIQEWGMRISPNPQGVRFSFCNKDTFDPDSNCFAVNQASPSRTYYEQKFFLDPEWDRLLELGRSPEHELGPNPPWKN